MKFLNGLAPTFDLTYDDVFMVPSRSAVGSRMEVDLASDDATGTTIPLVVANMTAVAGKRMAETVARRGAMAIIPQDIPVDVAIDTVAQVKASHRFYDTPVTVKPHHTCGYALGLIPKRAHGAAVVVDPDTNVPVGLVDTSDVSGVDRFTQVREVMSTELLTLPEGSPRASSRARPSPACGPRIVVWHPSWTTAVAWWACSRATAPCAPPSTPRRWTPPSACGWGPPSA